MICHKKVLLVAGVLVFCFFVFFLLFLTRYRKIKTKEFVSVQKIIDLKNTEDKSCENSEIAIQGMNVHETDENNKYNLEIYSKQCFFCHSSHEIKCKNIICTITDNSNQEKAYLSAQEAVMNRQLKRLFFPEKVHGIFKGLVVDGRNVCYDFSNHTMNAVSPIHYKHPFFNALATKSFFDARKNEVEMTDGVKCEFFISRDKQQRR